MKLSRINNMMSPSLPSLFDRIMEGDMMDWMNTNYSSTNTTLPAVNLSENDNEYLIEVAAPGMEKGDFKISLDNDLLSISSEKKEEKKEEKKGKYSRREFSYQSFQRTFTIPDNLVDGDKIKASYNEGILHVTLPKREETKPKPAREIKIS